MAGSYNAWFLRFLLIFELCIMITEIKGAKFDFGIFENFVANAELFSMERAIVHQLMVTQETLARNANAIRSFYNTKGIPSKLKGDHHHLTRGLADQNSIQFSDTYNEIINVSLFNKSASPDPNDIVDGALQGILMLQNTYTLKTDQFSKGAARSQLVDHSNPIPKMKVEGRESLQARSYLVSLGLLWLALSFLG